MDTRPDENGMAPRRRQHFRMLGLLRHPAEWRPEDYQHRGAQCCSVFVLGRRPPWLLVQLKLGVSPAHCSAEGQVHLDGWSRVQVPAPPSSASATASSSSSS
jgi:hypothetical protein